MGAGPNANAVLLIHKQPVEFSVGTAYCEVTDIVHCSQVINEGPSDSLLALTVILSLDANEGPRVRAVAFGIEYDSTVTIIDQTPCGDLEIPDPQWPNSHTGTAVAWTDTQRQDLIPVYSFGAYSTSSAELRLIPHPTQGAVVADDTVPSEVDTLACLGTFGFDVPGGSCCAATAVPLDPLVPKPARAVVAPQPIANDTIRLVNASSVPIVKVALFDVSGRLIVERSFTHTNPSTQYSLPAPAGVRLAFMRIAFVDGVLEHTSLVLP